MFVENQNDGLNNPCIPSILMTTKLARQEITTTGASPCIRFINLTEYLEALSNLNIEWRVTRH